MKKTTKNKNKVAAGLDLYFCCSHSTKYIGPKLDEKGLTHSNYSLLHKFLLKSRELCDEVLIRLSPLSVTCA